MSKIHVYFMPGLAAGSKIFRNILLPQDKFETHFLEWIEPNSINESIEEYAKRLCENIKNTNPILVGVSFGGIMVQEMSKLLKTRKIIIVSSIKSNKELPLTFKLASKTNAYKLVPTNLLSNIEDYESYFLTSFLKKRMDLYKEFFVMRTPLYLKWSISNILNWQQKEPTENITHIHGTEDEVFPVKNISEYIPIEKGTHIMILNKARIISKIIEEKYLS